MKKKQTERISFAWVLNNVFQKPRARGQEFATMTKIQFPVKTKIECESKGIELAILQVIS